MCKTIDFSKLALINFLPNAFKKLLNKIFVKVKVKLFLWTTSLFINFQNDFNERTNGNIWFYYIINFFSGLGFFPSFLPSQSNKMVYPANIQLPKYIQPVQQPLVHAPAPYAVPAPTYVVPSPKLLYPAMQTFGFNKLKRFPVPLAHTPYNPYHGHKETVTKSVLYSVLLSEILRRIWAERSHSWYFREAITWLLIWAKRSRGC